MKQTKLRYTHLAVLALLCCLFTANASAQTNSSPLPLPNPPRLVVDNANVLDAATNERMEAILENLNERADIQFAVVTVKTTGEQDIFDYSLAVARGWGIGSSEGEKNGALLLVAVDDRKYQIQISRHLEGDLPDGLTGEIGRRMREPFRAGDYNGGLMTAVQTFVATLAQKRGFSLEGIDQRYAYSDAAPRRSRPAQRGGISPCAVVFIIAIILIFLLSSRGRGGGGGGSGCLNLLLLNSLLNSGGRSSGWGGGGGWSGGGGGGGGFGGFGGGGDFGGGGSGGSW
ncbi:MAG: YgcG family protein [Pyrinomonadaceae bacterium]